MNVIIEKLDAFTIILTLAVIAIYVIFAIYVKQKKIKGS